MFLFPWLDWGIDISDFEKIDFLGHERFWAFSAPWKRDFLTLGPILKVPLGGPRVKILKIFFGNFQKISKVSKNIIWASYDHVVAQKLIFWTKISKKVVKTLTPPLVSFCRDILATTSIDALPRCSGCFNLKAFVTRKKPQNDRAKLNSQSSTADRANDNSFRATAWTRMSRR